MLTTPIINEEIYCVYTKHVKGVSLLMMLNVDNSAAASENP